MKKKKSKRLKILLKRAGSHQLAEKTATNTPTPKSELDKDLDLDTEAKEAAESYSDSFDEQQRRRLEELFKAQDFTVMRQDWKGPLFYEPRWLGGKAVLDYNMTHEFWDRVYTLMNSLEEETTDVKSTALEIKIMLDLMIMSHAKA